MATRSPKMSDLSILDDDARWADPYDCGDLLFAGIWYLHDVFRSRHPRSPLLERVNELGSRWNSITPSSGETADLTNAEMSDLFSEMNLLGTLGHSLWHLRHYLTSRGLRYELKELSQLGRGTNPAGPGVPAVCRGAPCQDRI